ncbi:MAG: HAD-IA family hydrolase [Clostridiales bacterium]|nr:HAD-IA family hydrolase [Clostridiales bacterium]
MVKAVIFDMFETLVTHYRTGFYFGENIAKDMGISEKKFREIWDTTDDDRTIGKLTFEDTIKTIMEANGISSEEILKTIVENRVFFKRKVFAQLDEDVLDMLKSLKDAGVKIALISNCFSEEVGVIKESALFSFFDVTMLSYEQGVKKPDLEIYRRAMQALGVEASECLYVGDGGSHELEAAFEAGMKPLQAKWFLKENNRSNPKVYDQFQGLEKPQDLLSYIK